MKNGKKHEKQKKETGKSGQRDIICRIVLLRLLARLLHSGAAVMLLPCCLCAEYSAEEILGGLLLPSFFVKHPDAARAVLVFFVCVGAFLSVCGFSALFAAECESMYTAGAELSPPKNMMTLRNGIRYGAFCAVRTVSRMRDAACFFAPTAAAAVLFAAVLFYGVERAAAVLAAVSFALIFALGVGFFACGGAGRERGTAVLYISLPATPLTAARASRVRRGDIPRALKREVRFAFLRLLPVVPAARLFADAVMRRKRGTDAIAALFGQ